MRATTRKIIDRSFTGLGLFSVVLVGAALVVLLAPIVVRGAGAFIFRATVEHRRVMLGEFSLGDKASLNAELERAAKARRPVYEAIDAYRREIAGLDFFDQQDAEAALDEFLEPLRKLLGPLPGEATPTLVQERYGQSRWDRALVVRHEVLNVETWEFPTPNEAGVQVFKPRIEQFLGTALEPAFAQLETHLDDMMQPRTTFYWRFLTTPSRASHFLGGIWAELLGTLYLTLGAILFAVPMGIISAVYLVEYAGENWAIGVLRSCISTLAGVPSIVFGLFGLAFFINTLHVSESRSVLAGSLTLAILILPVVIRASEEAIRAVPRTFKEAALSLGAGKWRTIMTVILPASLPGILTGIVISMGRAAGETAPIIFTAAVSFGAPLALSQTWSQGTPALPWNVYNLATEHQDIDEIRHVQYGMVLTLVLLVLLLNGAAIIMRARISRKLAT